MRTYLVKSAVDLVLEVLNQFAGHLSFAGSRVVWKLRWSRAPPGVRRWRTVLAPGAIGSVRRSGALPDF
jgi:hypothetical protein